MYGHIVHYVHFILFYFRAMAGAPSVFLHLSLYIYIIYIRDKSKEIEMIAAT
jgi:hypothetical protein